MRFYKKDLDEFAAMTASLNVLEIGMFSLLFDHAVRIETPLPLDDEQLSRIVKVTHWRHCNVMKDVLDRCFVKTPEGYVHPLIQKELERLARSRGAARRSANVRWHGSPTDAKRIDASMRNASDDLCDPQCDRNANAMLDHIDRWIDKPKPKTKPLASIHRGGHTRAHAYTGEAADGSMDRSNPLALREIVQAHGLKLTPKVEDGIDAAAREGVMPATFERAIADAQARADVKTPALYALKSARQWTAQPTLEPQTAHAINGHDSTLTPAQQFGAKLERTARTLTTITHEIEPETVEGAISEVRHVADKRRS